MPRVAANGLTLEYETTGDPAAPVVLLIMGLGMPLVAWPESFCRAIADGGFRVVRFDNRDSGLSTRTPGIRRPRLLLSIAAAMAGLPVRAPYTLEDMASDTVGLLDALGISDAHLVGISLGGMIGQVVAARFPSRARSLVSIMSSSGNPRVSRPKLRALRALLAKPANPNDADAVVDQLMALFAVIGSPGFPTNPRELRELLTRCVRRARSPEGTVRQLLAVAASGDRRALLRRIQTPTLVIHGACDPLVPPGAGRDTAAHVPGSRLRVIEGMGHDLAPGVQALLATAILEHCREVEAARSAQPG